MSRIISHVKTDWKQYCHRHFDERDATPDTNQSTVIENIQSLIPDLTAPRRKVGFWQRFKRTSPPCGGVYLWGGVGSGKTFIMDALYQFLPHAQKTRLHFHRFMHDLHNLRHAARGQTDPIKNAMAKVRARVIMLDEVVINDIGDAVLLREVLKHLRDRQIILLATSNCAPDDLYKDGLQRHLFLPAIELIKTSLRVVTLNTDIDYRRQLLKSQGTYHTPCDDKAHAKMENEMRQLSMETIARDAEIVINDRVIQTIRLSDDAVWFSFDALCGTARTASDYIQISCDYPAILLSDIPRLNGRDDAARRFIHLIDVLYDHRVKLIVSAATPAEQLYGQGTLKREFARTVSRLAEMGSQAYLSSRHRQHEN